MLDKEFWGEIISTYTDADAQADGIFTDISDHQVKFNEKIINRITIGVTNALEVGNIEPETFRHHLHFIAINSDYDGDGADAWGVFQINDRFENERFWLVPNEVEGYTLMLPSEY